ncbi:hypothetical protein FRC03_003009 [Tulasnella sp. 419]|nr:hypothetical protein FRC03_003009 [Tulasnella sp. 419]
MASSSVARLWEPRFIPSASLATAPEDIVVQILALLNVLDVLAVRRTCKRLYSITQARIVWLDLLRKSYRRRHLAPPDPQSTSIIPTHEIEKRAKRPFIFLHALADINSAKHQQTAWPIVTPSEEIAGGSNEDAGQSGIIAFEILPGGRWLFLVANRRTLGALHVPSGFHHRGPPRAVIFVWDLVLGTLRTRHSLPRAAHVAAIQLDATTSAVTVLVGLEKTRLEDPYFTALRMYLPPIGDDYEAVKRPTYAPPLPMRFEQAGGIKVSRTPRACTVHGNILAFADRAGNILFWDFIENSSSSIQVQGWPATKGKLLLVSNELVAVFNPASSTFSIHVIPPLVPLSFPGTGPQGQTAIAPIASAPLKRFRLPARNLILTFPKLRNRTTKVIPAPSDPSPTMSASSSATSSSGFASHEGSSSASSSGASGSGFHHEPTNTPQMAHPSISDPSAPHASNSLVSAYFLLFHPEDPANLHLGIIPYINPNEEEDVAPGSGDPDDGLGRASVEAVDGDLALAVANDEPDTAAGPSNDPNASIQQPADAGPAAPNNNNNNLNAEPTWLETLRCHDSTIAPIVPTVANHAPFLSTRDSFTFTTSKSKILYVGGTERILILRSTDEGVLEIFTTEAIWRRNWEAIHGPQQSPSNEPQSPAAASSSGRRRPEIAPWAEGDYQTLSYRATGEVWAACVDDLSGKVCMVAEDHNELYEIVVLDYGEGEGEQEKWRILTEEDLGGMTLRDSKGKGKARESEVRIDVKGKGKATVVGDDSGTPELDEDEEYGVGPSAIPSSAKGKQRAILDDNVDNYPPQLDDLEDDDEDDGVYVYKEEEEYHDEVEDDEDHEDDGVIDIEVDAGEDDEDVDPDIQVGLRYSESEYLNQYARDHHPSEQLDGAGPGGSGSGSRFNGLPSASSGSSSGLVDQRSHSEETQEWQLGVGNSSGALPPHSGQGPLRLR